MRVVPSRSCFADFCYLRPNHTYNANGRAASEQGSPGQIDFGDAESDQIETGHMGYFDADDLRP